MFKIFVFFYILLNSISIEYKDYYEFVSKEIKIFDKIPEIIAHEEVLAIYSGPITTYGPDCRGCIGITASGYDVRNTIYYNDIEYGSVHIVAADKSIPFGTIVRILNIDSEPIIAIVLDRGGAIGFNKNAYFDLLYPSEYETLSFGKKYAQIEILRYGF